MRASRALTLLAAALTAACATTPTGEPPRTPLPRVVVPETPEARRRSAEFYSDLGPDTIDVSSYPAPERRRYKVFASVCSRCHTLARAINAPIVSRGWWEFYIAGMRLRSYWRGRSLKPEQVKAVVDFLEYDSRARKVDRAAEFEALSDELKRRFDAEIARRVEVLQKANPRPLPPPLVR